MVKDKPCYWVYMLLCNNNTYYTGYTNDLAKRYQSHVNGTGRCKYTRSFKPIAIAQCWKINGDKSMALQLERTIKKLSRIDKEKIIANPLTLSINACPDSGHEHPVYQQEQG
ncbi:MAG: GIY-YIG nuclease family protein [Legionellales bacterium]